MSQYEGVCFPQHLIQGKADSNLQCMICYQIMTQPVLLQCGYNHTFGHSCIIQWFNKGKKQCPLCRKPVKNYDTNNNLKQKIPQYKAICNFCKNWQGRLSKVLLHQQDCQQYKKSIDSQLQEVIKDQMQILNKQINPHLQKQHLEIYEKYVRKWFWLFQDQRNWKWWWWADNSWWKQPCIQCNRLWHKYQKSMDMLEQKRIYLIKKINNISVIQKVRLLFDSNQ